jgi:solute carrier family 25 iron transporter 28/37
MIKVPGHDRPLTHADLLLLSKYFCAGAAARVTAAVLMSPVDVVKVRLQFQGRFKSVRKYANAKDAFITIFREEGFRGFFRGLPVRLLYITPAAAVSFMFYEQFSILLHARGHHHQQSHTNINETNSNNNNIKKKKNNVNNILFFKHPAVPLIAGGMARLIGTACRTPFDILRQRLQVQGSLTNSHYKGLGTFSALRLLIKTEGIRGLWTGYTISALRDVPFASIYFVTYELIKSLQQKYLHQSSMPNHLLAGAMAGGAAATCTIPFDVVKTRLQTLATLPVEERARYTGILSTFKIIIKEEGFVGLTKGLGPRLMYLMPAASLTFAAYEKYKRLLGLSS